MGKSEENVTQVWTVFVPSSLYTLRHAKPLETHSWFCHLPISFALYKTDSPWYIQFDAGKPRTNQERIKSTRYGLSIRNRDQHGGIQSICIASLRCCHSLSSRQNRPSFPRIRIQSFLAPKTHPHPVRFRRSLGLGLDT